MEQRTEGERRRAAHLAPLAIAAAVTAFMIAMGGRFESHEEMPPGAYTLIVVSGAALALYRKWPVGVLVTVTAAHFAYLLFGFPEGFEFVAILIALLLVTQEGKWRWTVAVALLSGISVVAADVTAGPALQEDTIPAVIAMTSLILLGLWLRARSDLLAEARERAEQAERTKEEEARRRVDEERLRIAREVHDTVAHSIATINVQAGAAVHVIEKRPEQAREALVAIKQASSEAMRELRSTLGMMRAVDGTSRLPSPRLAQLEDLVTMARRAGLDVEVEIRGGERALPSSIDLAAYRILQESITNVIRHADADHVRLSLVYGPRRLEVTVEDDGRGAGAGGAVDGNGIRGMRERVAILGGTFSAGVGRGRGFIVAAVLPYEE